MPALRLAEYDWYFPESYYSFFVLGEFYSAAGENDQAIASYRQAIQLNPRAKAFLEPKITVLQRSHSLQLQSLFPSRVLNSKLKK